MSDISLDTAQRIVSLVIAAALDKKIKPVAVALLGPVRLVRKEAALRLDLYRARHLSARRRGASERHRAS